MAPSPAASLQVTCSTPSSQTMGVDASVALNEPGTIYPNSDNNTGHGQSFTTVGAQSDLKVTGMTLSGPASETVGTAFRVSAGATVHNNGPFGPAGAKITFTLTAPAGCSLVSTQATVTVTGIAAPVSVATTTDPADASWLVSCDQYGNKSFSVAGALAADEPNVSDPNAGNNSGTANETTNLLVGACGADPTPAGGGTQNPSPTLVGIIQQLTSTGSPVPAANQTPLDCAFHMKLDDGHGAPIDDCQVGAPAQAPCSMTLSVNIDEPGR